MNTYSSNESNARLSVDVIGNITELAEVVRNFEDIDPSYISKKAFILISENIQDKVSTQKVERNKVYNLAINLNKLIKKSDFEEFYCDGIRCELIKIDTDIYLLKMALNHNSKLSADSFKKEFEAKFINLSPSLPNKYNALKNTTMDVNFNLFARSIELEISKEYLQKTVSEIDTYIFDATKSQKAFRSEIRSLCEILAFYDDLTEVEKKLLSFIKRFDVAQLKSSTGREKAIYLRQIDAILFLLFEFTRKNNLERFVKNFELFRKSFPLAANELCLLSASMRSSFLKTIKCCSLDPNLNNFFLNSQSHDINSLSAIQILLKDEEAKLSKSELIQLIEIIDHLSPEHKIKLARDLRRMSPTGVGNSDNENVVLDYFASLKQRKTSRKEALSKVLILFYAGCIGPKTLNYLTDQYRSFSLNAEDLKKICALSGYAVPYVITLNKQLYLNGYTNKIHSPSNFNNIKDYFNETLKTWQRVKEVEPQKTNPLVTIILTTLNPNIDLLKLSIISLLGQTYKNIEIILVDDASSKERSREIRSCLRNLEKTTNYKITYKRNSKNIGQYASRNLAISLAEGNYIAIQDDDDISHPERIKKQVELLEGESNLKACHAYHIRISDHARIMLDGNELGALLGDAPVSFMWNKSVFDDLGTFLNIKTRGDIEFRTRLERKYGQDSVKVIDLPLVYMRGGLNTVSSQYEYFYFNSLQALRKMMSKVPFSKGGSLNKTDWLPTLLR